MVFEEQIFDEIFSTPLKTKVCLFKKTCIRWHTGMMHDMSHKEGEVGPPKTK